METIAEQNVQDGNPTVYKRTTRRTQPCYYGYRIQLLIPASTGRLGILPLTDSSTAIHLPRGIWFYFICLLGTQRNCTCTRNKVWISMEHGALCADQSSCFYGSVSDLSARALHVELESFCVLFMAKKDETLPTCNTTKASCNRTTFYSIFET